MTQEDKIYFNIHTASYNYERQTEDDVEYTRTDVFINRVCEFLKTYRQDTYDGTGYIAGIVNDKTIEDLKKVMEE